MSTQDFTKKGKVLLLLSLITKIKGFQKTITQTLISVSSQLTLYDFKAQGQWHINIIQLEDIEDNCLGVRSQIISPSEYKILYFTCGFVIFYLSPKQFFCL